MASSSPGRGGKESLTAAFIWVNVVCYVEPRGPLRGLQRGVENLRPAL